LVTSVIVLAAALGSCSRAAPSAGPEPERRSQPTASSSAEPPEATLPRRLYEDTSLFTFKLPPRPDDWLARFHEPGQTFAVYEARAPVHPTPQRGRLVLQPLGSFGSEDRALLASLREYMEAFFALPVEMRDELPLSPSTQVRHRTRRDGARTWVQYETGSIMDDVLKKRLPEDAVVYVGITNVDLYPGEDWNFVFGEARFDQRVGVYSVARMFETFEGRQDTASTRVRGLARSAAILSHETGHAFGIAHCTRFECVMNGTNSLDELDRQFAEPCPVCLRKLAWNIGLDPVERYRRLRDFYRREHVEALATWIDRRLEQLGTKK
jgi:archaemetzincin